MMISVSISLECMEIVIESSILLVSMIDILDVHVSTS